MVSLSRFTDPVTDAKEKEIRSKASLARRKQTWTDWVCSRLISPVDVMSRVLPTTPLLDKSPGRNLAYWMGKCVLEVCKLNGSEYPPNGLLFHNQKERYDINPLCSTDERYEHFRSTFDAKMNRLQGSGLGTSSKQAERICPDEEVRLWSSQQFGTQGLASHCLL